MVSKEILEELYNVTFENYKKYKLNNSKAGYPIGAVFFNDGENTKIIWSGMNEPYDNPGSKEPDKHAERIAARTLSGTNEAMLVTSLLVSKPPCEDCAPWLKTFPNLKNIYYIAGDMGKEELSKKYGYNIQRNSIQDDLKYEIKEQLKKYVNFIIRRFREAEKNNGK